MRQLITAPGRRGALGLLVGLLAVTFCSTASAQILNSPSLQVERASHTATTLEDGRILIVGGENQAGAVGDAEIYDPTSGALSLKIGRAHV